MINYSKCYIGSQVECNKEFLFQNQSYTSRTLLIQTIQQQFGHHQKFILCKFAHIITKIIILLEIKCFGWERLCFKIFFMVFFNFCYQFRVKSHSILHETHMTSVNNMITVFTTKFSVSTSFRLVHLNTKEMTCRCRCQMQINMFEVFKYNTTKMIELKNDTCFIKPRHLARW